jgi:hypothetical protein
MYILGWISLWQWVTVTDDGQTTNAFKVDIRIVMQAHRYRNAGTRGTLAAIGPTHEYAAAITSG